jgi:hypothetical protein
MIPAFHASSARASTTRVTVKIRTVRGLAVIPFIHTPDVYSDDAFSFLSISQWRIFYAGACGS